MKFVDDDDQSADIHTLQNALDYLYGLSVMRQLPISITKCFAMIVDRQPSIDVKISINSISLPYVTSYKLL